MFTIQRIAAEIEQLKPDFTEFLAELTNPEQDTDKIILLLDNTQNIYERLLKTEIALMYLLTHNQRYSSTIAKYANSLLPQFVIGCVLSINSNSQNAYIYYNSKTYHIDTAFNPAYHIIAHIANPKPYLPAYLWDKVRTKKALQVEPPKQLQPNNLILEVFRNYVKSLKKPMPSANIIAYLEQLYSPEFADFRETYMDIIFSNCPSPSVDVQKLLAQGWHLNHRIMQLPSQKDIKPSKFMYLNRRSIQIMAKDLFIPVSDNTYNTRASEYKPFITGIQRVPEKHAYELSYLFDALLVLQISVNKTPNPVYSYFIDELTKYLAHPQHKPVIDELKQNLLTITQMLPTLAI